MEFLFFRHSRDSRILNTNFNKIQFNWFSYCRITAFYKPAWFVTTSLVMLILYFDLDWTNCVLLKQFRNSFSIHVIKPMTNTYMCLAKRMRTSARWLRWQCIFYKNFAFIFSHIIINVPNEINLFFSIIYKVKNIRFSATEKFAHLCIYCRDWSTTAVLLFYYMLFLPSGVRVLPFWLLFNYFIFEKLGCIQWSTYICGSIRLLHTRVHKRTHTHAQLITNTWTLSNTSATFI